MYKRNMSTNAYFSRIKTTNTYVELTKCHVAFKCIPFSNLFNIAKH